jgi:hypothetical protein
MEHFDKDAKALLIRVDERVDTIAKSTVNHDRRHEKIDNKLDQHAAKITALWTIFGLGAAGGLIWKLIV